jgi:hypothetical protein
MLILDLHTVTPMMIESRDDGEVGLYDVAVHNTRMKLSTAANPYLELLFSRQG